MPEYITAASKEFPFGKDGLYGVTVDVLTRNGRGLSARRYRQQFRDLETGTLRRLTMRQRAIQRADHWTRKTV